MHRAFFSEIDKAIEPAGGVNNIDYRRYELGELGQMSREVWASLMCYQRASGRPVKVIAS